MPFYFLFSSWIQICVTLKRDSWPLLITVIVLGHCCPSQGCRHALTLSVSEDKEKENYLTKGGKFQFLCACYPHSPVTGLSGAKYIPNTCWNKQHTRVFSDEYSIQSCLLSEPDEFTHYFFWAIEMQRPGVRDVMWICDIQWQTLNLKTKECCFHSHSDFCSHSLSLADIIFW